MFIRKRLMELATVLVSSLAVVACSGSVVHAGSSIPGPLTVKMSLATGQTISLGEPIVIHYEMSNALPTEHLILSHGPSAGDWYTIRLADGSGQAITTITSRRVHRTSGLFQDKEVGIVHGGKAEGYITVPTYRTLTRPGKYTLNVHARLPYVSEPDTPVDVDPATHLSLDQNYVLPFMLTASDATQLRNTAERLRQEAESPEYSGSAVSIVEALFSMPENQALASWQSLTSNPDVPERVLREAVIQLARLHSVAAVDLLAQLYWNPAQSPGMISWAEVGQHIAEIYNSSDASLKAHIRELFADHGVQLPDVMPEKSQPN